jgi:hypothetical protein
MLFKEKSMFAVRTIKKTLKQNTAFQTVKIAGAYNYH